jgi:hypothetical protein
MVLGLTIALGLVISSVHYGLNNKSVDMSKFQQGERRFYTAIAKVLPIINQLEKYKDAKNQGIDAERAFIFNAIRNGVKHLDNDGVDKWHYYRFKMAMEFQPYCQGILTGRMSANTIFEAVNYLNDKELLDFVQVLMIGAKNYILDRGNPVTDMKFVNEAIKTIIDNVEPDKAERLRKVLGNPGTASPQEQCFATIEILYNFKNVKESLRYPALKTLSGGM